jgi:hypothetical protein
MNDFDRNGVIDKIISKTADGKDKPVFMKREVQEGLPGLKKQNLRHASYATKSIRDLFTEEQLSSTIVKQVNYSSSCIALNRGNGHFELRPLPHDVQLSSVKSVVCLDINSDGHPDLVYGGNEFNFQPQLGRLDASLAGILLNDGSGNFILPDESQTGLRLEGMVRDIAVLESKKNKYLLFLRNGDQPVLYQIKNSRKD